MSARSISRRSSMPNSNRKKGLKVLGLSAMHMVQSFLENDEQGTLGPDEYFLFWRDLGSVGSERDNTEWLRMCVSMLLEVMDGKKQPAYPIHALINTISFLSLRMPVIAGSTKLRAAMRNVSTNRSDRGHFSAADEIIRAVYKRLVEQEPAIDTLLIQATTLYSAQELTVLSDFLHYPSLDGSKVAGGELAFVYFYLRDLALRDNETCLDLVGKVYSMFHSLPQTLKLSPILAQTKLLAIMHILRVLIMSRHIKDDRFLANSQKVLRPFLSWPSAFSKIIQSTLLMVHHENLSPGISFIERLVGEGRVPSIRWTQGATTHVQNPVYYIIDSSSTVASQWFKVMAMLDYDSEEKLGSFSEPKRRLTPDIHGLVLLFLFQTHLGSVSDSDIQVVRFCDQTLLERAFLEAVSVARDSMAHYPDKGNLEEAAARLLEIKQYIASQFQGEDSNSISNLPDELPDSFIPMMPEVAHVACVDPVWYRTLPKGGKALASSYPVSPAKRRLEVLLSQVASVADVEDPVVVRVVLAGSDRVFHSALCGYLALLAEEPHLFEGVDMRWYVVPFDDNLLASFIARHDGWYNRHIFTPFRARPFLLPFLDSSDLEFPSRKFASEAIVPPGQLLRDCVESYVHEAQEVLPLQVYKVEGWQNADHASKRAEPDQVIPFVARLEISARVEARHYQTLNGDPRSLQEIIKNVNLALPQLRIHYTTMNLARHTTESTRHDNLVFDGIVLANIPISKDPCFPAEPTEPWLEMYAQVHSTSSSSSKKTRSGAGGEYRSRVAVVDISSPVAFSILVDSSCFGPFYRIVISAEDAHLPIRTFFPVRSI